MNRYSHYPVVPTVRSLFALSALALASLVPTVLASPVYAQTPTSTVYAFTDLNTAAASVLGTNTGSRANGISGGVAVGDGQGSNTSGNYNALRWNTDGTVTNLHSQLAGSGINLGTNATSYASGISGGVTVGYGYGSNTNSNYNALRWNADGTVTNLNTLVNLGTGAYSEAYGISGGVTVGYGYGSNTNSNYNALRWNADDTVTNLHSQIASNGINLGTGTGSVATAISGGVTVGSGYGGNTNSNYNALRWNADGTVTNLNSQIASSGINLGTGAYSEAYGISGGVTIGTGYGSNTGNFGNALRWNADGTVTNLHSQIANSGINLGTGSQSSAVGISGGVTIGSGFGSNTGFNANALRWNADGTALDLQQFVTNGVTYSFAYAIDASTGVIAGSTSIGTALWTPLNTGTGGANSLAVKSGATTTINQNFTQGSGLTNVNGTLSLTGNTLTIAGGTLNGAGTIAGNVIITGSGILAPGNSPGTLTVSTGNFTMNGGTYSIDLAGLNAGQFDVLSVGSGSASFTGGTFALNLLNGYTPSVNDFFNIVTTTGGVTGANTVTVPQGWAFTANGTNGRLSYLGATVVPEAGAGLLISLAGVLALGAVSIRRKSSAAA